MNLKKIKDSWDDDSQYKYYSSIDEVIEEVKSKGATGYIWENGEIRDDVFICNVLELLEGLKSFETKLTEDEFDRILEEGEKDNSYNWSANISNDLSITWLKDGGCLVEVHLSGDVRANYSNYFSIKSVEDLYECDGASQSKAITDRYIADMEWYSEGFDVYDTEIGDTIGTCYSIDYEEVIKWIEENKE